MEGLANYVSHALNPGASETDLVLNFPAGMPAGTREKLPQAWRQLSSVLDSSDSAVYGELFTMSSGQSTELPRRRGYYLGYLIAKDAARTRDLATLASMDCQQVRGLIESTISKLSKEAM